MDPRVAAIRSNKLVGFGTCSSVDECWSDSDLIGMLDEANVSTPEEAVRWAVEAEETYLENGLNQRWGDEDDSQLSNYRAFKEAKRKLGL